MSRLRAHLHLFSGTGNTARAASMIRERLELAGYETGLTRMDQKPLPCEDSASLHVVLFPMYGFDAPTLVHRYLHKLAAPPGARAAILAVGGTEGEIPGNEGISLYRTSKLLRKRGFTVFHASLVSYPNNWVQFVSAPDEQSNARICRKADAEVERIADQLVKGTVSFKKQSGAMRLLFSFISFGYRHVGRRMLGKLFVADSRCNGCSRCARTCPMGTISMKKGVPSWNWSCAGCQRCINTCPREAIQSSTAKLLLQGIASLLPIWPAIWLGSALPLPSWAAWIAALAGYSIACLVLLPLTSRLVEAAEARPAVRRFVARGPSVRHRRYRGPSA
ncbi:EFR1 family ferrodoxin [Gorillibacterium sp. CAU 1737]|uniref:EFR1 family ferrodoxin n=1 Tax=Gorillibacterium sp. CAU 1737 TaxID=3140362 RepID=UPI00326008BF